MQEQGETSTVATEHQWVVAVPDVVRVGIVPVDPRTVGIAFDVEHVQVAISVRYVSSAIRITALSPYERAEFYSAS